MSSFCLIKNKDNNKDINGFGSVSHNFLMSQNFISCEEYVNFLNSVSIRVKELNLYNEKLSQIINLTQNIYTLKEGIYPHKPISFVNLENIKIYCNYLNQCNLQTIDTYPYNIKDHSVAKEDLTYWIPSYDEWYKATYYDSQHQKYYCFPHGSDDIPTINQNQNSVSPYGLINAGLKYFTMIDEYDDSCNKYAIAGGSSNRSPIHSKSGTKYFVSKNYYASYISARICKKSQTKKYILKLYDTYGDGWGENYIIVNDANYKPITDKLQIAHGYGPIDIELNIDHAEKSFNIQYYKNNHLSYENYYEIYNESNDLIFASNMYEPPPRNTIIKL